MSFLSSFRTQSLDEPTLRMLLARLSFQLRTSPLIRSGNGRWELHLQH